MSCIESPDCGQASHKAAEAGKLAFTRTESAPSWGALSQGRSGFLDCSAPRAPCAPDAAPPRVLCEGASRRAPLTAKPVLHFLAAAASCARRNVSQQVRSAATCTSAGDFAFLLDLLVNLADSWKNKVRRRQLLVR